MSPASAPTSHESTIAPLSANIPMSSLIIYPIVPMGLSSIAIHPPPRGARRLIEAEWVLPKRTAGSGIGAGAGAATDLPELAAPTPTRESLGLAQAPEKGDVPIDLPRSCGPHLPRREGQEARRLNVTSVGD